MIKGVLFDLDGVIVDTAELHFVAWQKLANELGIEIDRAFNEQLKGVSRQDSLSLILKRGNVVLEQEKFEAMMTKKNDHYLDLLETIGAQDILPGITELLAELKKNQIKIGLASASKNGKKVLEKLGLLQQFDALGDPSLVPSKPDPGIFLQVASLLGLTAEECIGVEDAEAGVLAINKAGMRSIGVLPNLTQASCVVNSTAELKMDLFK
jgi:beta-phosphoglucomutase